MPKSKKSKTHFEQVPLEIVKSTAREDGPDEEVNGEDVIVEASKKKLSRVPGSRINPGECYRPPISRTARREPESGP